MAEGIVGPLLSKLQEVAVNEAEAAFAVGGEIDKLREKLMWLQAVVHETDLRSRHDRNRLISVLGSQIREVSFDAEDAVDKFHLRVSLSRMWWRAAVELVVRLPAHIYYRFVLSREIQSMNARLEEIANNKSTYSEVVNTTGKDDHERWKACRAIPLNRQDWDMECEVPFFLGVRSEMRKKLHMRLKSASGLKWEVIPVAGVGGVGKRAFLRHAYKAKGSFASENDITEWGGQGRFDVCVLMSSPREIEGSYIVPEIKKTVREVWSLNNNNAEQIRFLVVIDSPIKTTVWSKLGSELEDELKLDDINACGNVLLMTPSFREVNGSTIKLETLKGSDSEKLFNQMYDPNGSKGHNEEQKKILENIMKITGGLPLAIVLVARLMTTMDSNKWDAAADYIMKSDEDSKLQTIMSVCIDDLPDELKSCLLFTAGFPENRAIDAHQLVRLWMAEGFLTQHHKLETEKLGQRYLKELIYRGLLQLVSKSAHGDGGCVEQVAIHDQIHPLLRTEAKRTGFMDVHYGGHTPAWSNTRRLSLLEYNNEFNALSNGLGKLRTVVSYFDDCHLKVSWTVMEGQGERQKEVAASDGTTSPTAESGSKCEDGQGQKARRLNIRKLLKESPYLRVINLEGINVGEKLPDRIGDMVHLQYLGIRRSKELKRLPSSVGNLHNLQTIDVRETGVTELPESVWKIKTLRHVLGNELVFPTSGDDLKLLQTLETVTFEDVEPDLCRLLPGCGCHCCCPAAFGYSAHGAVQPQPLVPSRHAVSRRWRNLLCRRGRKFGLPSLRRLHVAGFEESQLQDLEAVLKETKALESLSLSGHDIPINLFKGDASRRSCLRHVVSLEVDGELNKEAYLEVDGRLNEEAPILELFHRLTRLVLRSINITEGFIKLSAKLPDLAELLLHKVSYAEEELNLCTDCEHAFKSLTVLEISDLPEDSKLKTVIKPGRRGDIETRFTGMQCNVKTCEKCGPKEEQQQVAPDQSGQPASGRQAALFRSFGGWPLLMAAAAAAVACISFLFYQRRGQAPAAAGRSEPAAAATVPSGPTAAAGTGPSGTATADADQSGSVTAVHENNQGNGGKDSPSFRDMIMEAIDNGELTKTGIKNYIKETYGDPVRKHLERMVRNGMLRSQTHGRYVYYFLRGPTNQEGTKGDPTNKRGSYDVTKEDDIPKIILEAIKENLSSKTNIELYINKKYGDPVVKHIEKLVNNKELKAEERHGQKYYSRP